LRRVRPASLAAFVLAVLPLLAAVPLAQAQEGPVPVEVEVYVINFGNYDTGKGTYVMDFYLTFRWDPARAPANFTPTRFEFMNGRAAGAPDRISDTVDPETGVREVDYRIQANLYSEPRFQDYPYDTQTLELTFEDAVNDATALQYVPVMDGSGIDEGVRIPGWRIGDVSLEETTKTYPPDEAFSRTRFSVQISREPLSSTLKSFLPPFAFMLVAGLGFFFHPSKVANRITLGTGMLIAAVGFHISQTVSLPPVGTLIFFDKVMIATYAFLVGCLMVGTLIAIDEDWWKDRDYTKTINLAGGLLTLAAPAVTFLALYLL
jgi:hypothetical protein